MTQVNYHLTGVHADKTIKLGGKYQFNKGVLAASHDDGKPEQLNGLTRYLAKTYHAHPEGSKALADAQKQGGDNAKGDKDGNAGRKDKLPAGDGAQAGAKGNVPATGGGQPAADAGADPAGAAGGALSAEQAIGQLDHKNNAHWTSTGLPAMKAVAELLGRPVTRDEINAAAPGFNRAAAEDAATA